MKPAPQGFLMTGWPRLGRGDEPGSSREHREGQDQVGRGTLWVDFFFLPKEMKLWVREGKKGGSGTDRGLLPQRL